MRQVELARSLLGVKWLHQGRDATVGIDCVGLLLLAFEIPSEDEPTVYGRSAYGHLMDGRLRHHLGEPVSDMRPGDAVLMGFGDGGLARHVGLLADSLYGGLSIIHTDSIVGKVVEHPLDEKWLRRIRNVYRRAGVTHE